MSQRPIVSLSFEASASHNIQIGDVVVGGSYQNNITHEAGKLEFVVTNVTPCGCGQVSIAATAKSHEGSAE